MLQYIRITLKILKLISWYAMLGGWRQLERAFLPDLTVYTPQYPNSWQQLVQVSPAQVKFIWTETPVIFDQPMWSASLYSSIKQVQQITITKPMREKWNTWSVRWFTVGATFSIAFTLPTETWEPERFVLSWNERLLETLQKLPMDEIDWDLFLCRCTDTCCGDITSM